jgi:CRP-like cAMP-binding protein
LSIIAATQSSIETRQSPDFQSDPPALMRSLSLGALAAACCVERPELGDRVRCGRFSWPAQARTSIDNEFSITLVFKSGSLGWLQKLSCIGISDARTAWILRVGIMATMQKTPEAIHVDRLCKDNASDALQIIAKHKSCDRRLNAGHDLFRIGEPCDAIYYLIDGWIFQYMLLPDGQRQIFNFALPGDLLGLNPAYGSIMTYSAQALTDTVVCVIPNKMLSPLSKQYPEIGLQLASLISRDQSLSFAHMTSIGRHSARERVAQLIIELFIRCRLYWPGHRIEEMRLPLTQEHIGDAMGLSAVHVSRVLSDLNNEGILRYRYRRLSILDPDRLMEIACIDPELIRLWIR